MALTVAGDPSESRAASSAQRKSQRDAFASGAGNSDADVRILPEALPWSAESYAPPPGLDRENTKAVAEAEGGAEMQSWLTALVMFPPSWPRRYVATASPSPALIPQM